MKFLFFLLTICPFIYSQNNLSDTEFEILKNKARIQINKSIDSSFFYSNIIKQSKNNSHKAFAFGIQSYLHQLKKDTISSNISFKKALVYLDMIPVSTNKLKLESYLLNYAGLINWKRKNLKKALNYYIEGKTISIKINDIVQIVNFNTNIASVYSSAEKFELAIGIAKESDSLLNKNILLYEDEKFKQSKSTVNYKIGTFYEKLFYKNKAQLKLLDSAEKYYKKVIIFSNNSFKNNIKAKTNLGSIYYLKGDFGKAEKIYIDLLQLDKNILHPENVTYLNVNLGELYFKEKKFNEALICFKKVDSINKKPSLNETPSLYSNYYQAKIYNILEEDDKAIQFSKIYFEKFKKDKSKLNEEILSLNHYLGKEKIDKEIETIAIESNKKIIKKTVIKYLIIAVIIILLILLAWNIFKRIEANKKIEKLVQEFKKNNNSSSKVLISEKLEKSIKKTTNQLNIDEEKEIEILEKLQLLEEEKIYLNQNFTLHYVAKKIKTNTTYLSYVVNKNFNKSFGEYANELKINFAIEQLINNPIYRKYSTQAIAESVGFKKANSFSKSFSKKTGVSPIQFAKRLEKNN